MIPHISLYFIEEYNRLQQSDKVLGDALLRFLFVQLEEVYQNGTIFEEDKKVYTSSKHLVDNSRPIDYSFKVRLILNNNCIILFNA